MLRGPAAQDLTLLPRARDALNVEATAVVPESFPITKRRDWTTVTGVLQCKLSGKQQDE